MTTKKSDKTEDEMDKLHKTIRNMLDVEFVSNRKMLEESWKNFDLIAPYCQTNFQKVTSKQEASQETKAYANRALMSVISQINRFAHNFQVLLDCQGDYMDQLASLTDQTCQRVNILNERTARHRIGKIVTKKTRPLVAGTSPTEKQQLALALAKKHKINFYSFTKYSPKIGVNIRQGIDYSVLDSIGSAQKIKHSKSKHDHHAVVDHHRGDVAGLSLSKSSTLRLSKFSNLSSLYRQSADLMAQSTFTLRKGESAISKNPPTLVIPQAALPLVQPPPQPTQPPPPPPLQQQPVQPAISQNTHQTNPFATAAEYSNPQPSLQATVQTRPESAASAEVTIIQKVLALYDYNAEKDDELSFKENDVIDVTAKNDDGWWEGVLNGVTGLFPGNYVDDFPGQ